MRPIRWSLICALVVAPPLAAQGSERERGRTWSVAVTASLAGFRGAAMDTTVEGGIAVRPGQGVMLGITLARRSGPWALSLGVSHLPTEIEAVSSDIAVRTRTDGLERVRFAVLLGRRIAGVGGGRLELRAGPTLDHWSADGDDARTVGGGAAELALQLPAGAVVLENVIGLGWSASPFRAPELPAGYRREALRVVTVGLGTRFRL